MGKSLLELDLKQKGEDRSNSQNFNTFKMSNRSSNEESAQSKILLIKMTNTLKL